MIKFYIALKLVGKCAKILELQRRSWQAKLELSRKPLFNSSPSVILVR